MKLESIICPWPESPRTDVNKVIVECKCPRCKKYFGSVFNMGILIKSI